MKCSLSCLRVVIYCVIFLSCYLFFTFSLLLSFVSWIGDFLLKWSWKVIFGRFEHFFVAIHIPLSLVPWSFLSEMVNFWVQSHCIHLHCFRACFHGDTGFSWLSDKAFVWLSDWSEVQIVLYGPANATASQISSSLASFKSRWFYLSAYPGCPGKEAVKRV